MHPPKHPSGGPVQGEPHGPAMSAPPLTVHLVRLWLIPRPRHPSAPFTGSARPPCAHVLSFATSYPGRGGRAFPARARRFARPTNSPSPARLYCSPLVRLCAHVPCALVLGHTSQATSASQNHVAHPLSHPCFRRFSCSRTRACACTRSRSACTRPPTLRYALARPPSLCLPPCPWVHSAVHASSHPLARTSPCSPTRLSLALLACGADTPALLTCLSIQLGGVLLLALSPYCSRLHPFLRRRLPQIRPPARRRSSCPSPSCEWHPNARARPA
ncbi:hypothetical protein FRC08_000684 [Ceratobasidium sp. 394]|nr:hypothetical protein FRC08_000684 [Ceratobasidium sp. 394]